VAPGVSIPLPNFSRIGFRQFHVVPMAGFFHRNLGKKRTIQQRQIPQQVQRLVPNDLVRITKGRIQYPSFPITTAQVKSPPLIRPCRRKASTSCSKQKVRALANCLSKEPSSRRNWKYWSSNPGDRNETWQLVPGFSQGSALTCISPKDISKGSVTLIG